ncbi:MAG: hypothetical protein QM706_09280 [Nitrospira sp.]
MRIDTGASYLFAYPHIQVGNPSGHTVDSASLSTAPDPNVAQSDLVGSGTQEGIRRADFTGMTRQDMQEWVNVQIRSGNLSLDDTMPFMMMTMKVRVSDNQIILAEGDHERINFMERARLGIEGARSCNDQVTLKMLQSATEIMRSLQGQAIGVHTRA